MGLFITLLNVSELCTVSAVQLFPSSVLMRYEYIYRAYRKRRVEFLVNQNNAPSVCNKQGNECAT